MNKSFRKRDGIKGIPGTLPDDNGYEEDLQKYLASIRDIPTRAMDRDEYEAWHRRHCDKDLHT